MQKVLAWLARLEKAAFIFLILALVAVVAFGTAVRYISFIPGAQMAWTEEMARLLFVWAVALTMAAAQREGNHFKIDIVVERWSPLARSLVSLLIEVLLLVCFFLFIVVGMRFSIGSFRTTTPTMQWPLTVFNISLVVGAFIMLIQGSIRLGMKVARRSWQ